MKHINCFSYVQIAGSQARPLSFPEIEKPSKCSIENTQKEPPKNHLKTTEQSTKNQLEINNNPSTHHRLSDTKPLTNRETMENENKQTTTMQGKAVALDPCLKEFDGVKGFKLSDDEKIGLMAYSIDRVTKAIDYASHPAVMIKKDLISLLHWHCKQPNPVAPPDDSGLQESSIPQHKLAYEYSEFLKENGFLSQFEANLKSIPEGIATILEDGRWTTVSLNNNPEKTLRSDFSKSKDMIRKENFKAKNQINLKHLGDKNENR